MDKLNENGMVQNAKKLCEQIHKNAKYLFGNKMLPYYHHCFYVANLIQEKAEKDIDTDFAVILAYLHDSIEDTPITKEYLTEHFNAKIANGVMALSKNKKLPHDVQLEDSIARIKQQPREVAIVKLADRICNLQTIPPQWSVEKSQKYLEAAKMIFDELGFASENLKNELEQAMKKYVEKISEQQEKAM